MAPAYKLTYFDGRGVSEPIRFLFKYGNIDFEDIRIKIDQWPGQLKEKTPFGQLPFLEHNGKTINQSTAIARYVAKQVKLVGNDDWENLEIDAVVDTICDLRTKMSQIFWEQDAAKKKTMKETALKETVPYYLGRFEKLAEKNGGYLAAGRLTWADLFIVSTSPSIDDFVEGDAFAKYPKLKALREKVHAIPNIKKWVDVRPKSPF